MTYQAPDPAPLIATLQSRWLTLCSQAGLDGAAGWTNLVNCYCDPARAYHNLTHVADCLSLLDECAHLAGDSMALEYAIWFHDIVYDTHAHDNEVRSAAVATDFLSGTGFEHVVADLILATRHSGQPASPDASLLCDIDLAILGSDPGVYDSYAQAIRQEYEWVPLADYAKGRIRVLESFVRRSSVYSSMQMVTRFEDQARANLERELASLAVLGE